MVVSSVTGRGPFSDAQAHIAMWEEKPEGPLHMPLGLLSALLQLITQPVPCRPFGQDTLQLGCRDQPWYKCGKLYILGKSLCEGTSPRYPSFLESYQPFSSGQGLSTQMSLSPSSSPPSLPASNLGGPAVPTAQEGVFPVCCRKLISHQPRIADWHAWVEGLEGKAVLHGEAVGLVLAFLDFYIYLGLSAQMWTLGFMSREIRIFLTNEAGQSGGAYVDNT